MGASELREIYLKTDNYIKGEYFARLIKVRVRAKALISLTGPEHWSFHLSALIRFFLILDSAGCKQEFWEANKPHERLRMMREKSLKKDKV